MSKAVKIVHRESPPKKPCAPLQTKIATRPMDRIAMHILGLLPETNLGNKYILVVLHTVEGSITQWGTWKLQLWPVCQRVLLPVWLTWRSPHRQGEELWDHINQKNVLPSERQENTYYTIPPPIQWPNRVIQSCTTEYAQLISVRR
jgi:hypothetical protein